MPGRLTGGAASLDPSSVRSARPLIVALTAEDRARGGRNAAAKRKLQKPVRTTTEGPAAPQTLEECLAFHAWAADAVKRGLIDDRTANAIAKHLVGFRMTFPLIEVVKEVRALRRELDALKKAGPGRLLTLRTPAGALPS